MKKSFLRQLSKAGISIMLTFAMIGGSVEFCNRIRASSEEGVATLPVYKAVEVLAQAESMGAIPADSVWTYTAKKLKADSLTGYSLPDGDWFTPYLTSGKADSEGVNAVLTNQLIVGKSSQTAKNEGFGTANGKVYTFVGNGSANGGYAGAITFIVPESGTVRLYDPDGGCIETAGKSAPWWTLHDNALKVGAVIYKNDQKIWPDSGDYYELTGDNWKNGYEAGVTSLNFPDLSDIEVSKGDALRIALIPLTQSWGYLKLSPQVAYQSIRYDFPSYNAVSTLQNCQDVGGVPEDSEWTYTASTLIQDAVTGYRVPSGKWWTPKLAPGKSDSSAVNNMLPDQLIVGSAMPTGKNEGFSVLDGKIYTFVGNQSTYGGYAGAITFIAPKDGVVELHDPQGGNIETAGKGAPWWTLHDNGLKVGVAVYKNNERIWPENQDYFEMTGDNWQNGYQAGVTSLKFPDISNIEVLKGDALRVALIPLTQNWGYLKLSPQVDYQTIYRENLPSYNAVETLSECENNGAVPQNSVWTYNAKKLKIDSETGASILDGNWFSPELKPGSADSSGVNSILPKQLIVGQSSTTAKNEGFGTANGKIYTFVGNGATFGGYAAGITFVAPYTGKIRLSDPNGGIIGTAGKSAPWWTLHNGGDAVSAGIAIYKNDTKIWPLDQDYFTLKADNWSSGTLVAGVTSVKFPEIEDVSVSKGDSIRIALIPRSISWGYLSLSPQVDYTQMNDHTFAGIVGIKVCNPDKKSVYFEDETPDLDEMTVRRVLYNGIEEDITEYNVRSDISDQPGNHPVIVSYSEGGNVYTAKLNIRVLEKQYGDVNADTFINSADVVLMKKHLIGCGKDCHTTVVDTNNDGKVNIKDVIRLKKYLSHLIDKIGPEDYEIEIQRLKRTGKWIDPDQQLVGEPKLVSQVVSRNGRNYVEYLGEPYLEYGVQIVPGRVTGMTEDMNEQFYRMAAETNYKTVIAALNWNQLEPAENAYNLYKVDWMLKMASKYGLRLEILWFGDNVCGNRSCSPKYVLRDTERFPLFNEKAFDYSNNNLLEREKAALKVLCDYLYNHDTKHSVSSIQILNEGNFSNIYTDQPEYFLHYLDQLGQVVKNGPYRVVTRVNLVINESVYNSDLPEKILGLSGIDIVGPDVYTSDLSYYTKWANRMGKGEMSGNVMHFAEAPGQMHMYPKQVLNAFANNSGYNVYELKSYGNVDFDFGIYRSDASGWTKRDGTQQTTFQWNSNVKILESNTDDIICLNGMINSIDAQIASAENGNFKMLGNNGAATIGNVAFSFATLEQNADNAVAAVVKATDGYYYLFTLSAEGTVTLSGNTISGNASVGRLSGKSWSESSVVTPSGSSLVIRKGNVYRFSGSQLR